MINWDKVWDTAVNKLHVVLGALCQGSLAKTNLNEVR